MSIPAMELAALSGRRGARCRTAGATGGRVVPVTAGDARLDEAIYGLARAQPQFSARTLVTRSQTIGLALVPAGCAVALVLAPHALILSLATLFALWLAINVVFRAWLVWMGSLQVPAQTPRRPGPAKLPVYSIVVPLYREANIVPRLVASLRALDYPPDHLDVKLVVEADDAETLAAVEAANAESRFQIVRVPPSLPRTKPKALNYALPDVRGDFAVIYDAEDRPEPDQLRKAVAAFRAYPKSVACLQARLNFFNAHEGWIPKMFALDYGLWFDLLLPGLDRAGIPMPLGGTSNHFRIEALRAIRGWDPFNVTEDADLGIRLARLGYRVRTLDSTTFEEAANCFDVWLKQRSRWLKGYMQTWLVHMRAPRQLLRNAGVAGFIGFQLFIGGTVASALVNPVLWCVFAASQFGPGAVADGPIAHISLAGLVLGNGVFAYLNMLGPLRRGWLELSPQGILAPVYWLMISLACYRGLFQLVRHASHWEKTPHGLSADAMDAAP